MVRHRNLTISNVNIWFYSSFVTWLPYQEIIILGKTNRTVEAKIAFSIPVSHRRSKWTMCIILVSIASNPIIQYKSEIYNKMFSFETSFPRKSSLTTCQFTWSWLIPDWIRSDKIGKWLFYRHEKINLKKMWNAVFSFEISFSRKWNLKIYRTHIVSD